MSSSTSRRRFMGVFVVLACALLPTAVRAANGTWTPSAAGTYYWTNAPNWVSGTIPRAAGDAAAVTADLAGAQTINLGAAITNGTLAIGDPAAPFFSYTLANGTGGSLIMSNSGATAVIGKSGQTSDLISANITLGDNLVLTNAQNDKSQSLRLSGIISGAKRLTVNGAGPDATIELSGVNTFTNVLTLNSGTLRANTSASALGAGTASLTLNGGTLDFNHDAALAFSRNTTVNGPATLVSERSLGGGGYTYTLGTLSIGSSTLTVGGGNVSGGTAGLTFGATTLSGSPTFAINNPVSGGVTLLTLGAITDNGNSLTLTGSGNFAQAGIWSGTGGLTLDAGFSGAATLSQANTFTGGITIAAGTLKAGVNGCIPNGAGKGNVVVNGKLDLNGYSPTVNGVSGTGIIDQSWVGAAVFTLTAGGNDQTSAFGGVITNTGAALALTKTGTGTLTLTGANSYSGATAINGGALSINSLAGVNAGASALGAPTTAATGTLAIGSATTAGTLIYTGSGHASDRVINLAGTTGGATLDASGTGPLVLSSALTATGAGSKTLTLTGTNTGTNSLLGGIVNGAGMVALVKTNSGTWVLAGINTFTGTTTVAGGQLRVNGSLAAGSPVTVWSNATLGGNGTCAGAVTTRAGATLAPGVEGTAGGALTVRSLALSNGCMTAFEFSTAPTNDTLVVTNGLTLPAGAGVYLYAEGTTNAWTTPGLYNLIRYTGTLTGSATNLGVLNPQPGKTYNFVATNGWISLRADLPEVAVLPASNVTTNGVRMNGLVVNGGGAEMPSVYFCWDVTDKGTSDTSAWGHAEYAGASWAAGQAFSNEVTGLLSGSNYTYRCFASNSAGFGWSPTAASFRVVCLPAVTNTGATTVNSSTELLRGAVTDTGADTPQVWFLVWLSGGASTNAYGVGATTGACSVQATGLLPGSNYVFMLMASNLAGVAYSGTNGFQTVSDYYVRTNGNDSAAGTDWSTALLTISNAVGRALPGATIWVTNGTYGVNVYATNGPYVASGLVLTNGIALRSVNGAASTVIMRSNAAYAYRPLYISNINAVVDGFTISNGTRGGVYIDGGGTVSNCVIRDNNGALNVIFAGGGVYLMNGGLVKNCRIINNSITYSGGNGGNGGGVYINGGGMLDTCIISNNVASYGSGLSYGGGVYMIGGRIRNCLIANNRHPFACGGVYCNGGTIESCTIVDNYCPMVNGVGGLYNSNGRVLNSIVAFNTCVTGTWNYVNAGAGVSYTNSCTYPTNGLAGSGNTAADPQFRDRASGDYRLLPGPCVDTGTNQMSWMGDAADLGGSPRIQDGLVDMGAYETTVGALACSFDGTPLTAFMSNTVVFSANVNGTNTADLYYQWSFTNGPTFDAEGLGMQVATNLYWPGLYSVRLVVTNAAGEVATQVKANYIKVGPATNYVSTNGASVYPYATWPTAATNIQAAIDAGVDGTTVVVADGGYSIATPINLNQNIKVASVNGAASTVIRRGAGNCRIFYVSRPAAVIDGFTISNANLGAIYLDAGGTVSNCIIRDNVSLNLSANGGGVFLNGGGLVYNCQIFNNKLLSSGGGGASGGGVYLNLGGLVDSCVISNNIGGTDGSGGAGGGVYMSGGRIRNCLVFNNRHNMYASGVYCSGGMVESCTIASNRNPLITGAGGLYSTGGRILNSIVYFNTASNTTYNYTNAGASSSYTNSCTFPTNGLVGKGNIDSDPLFANLAAGNCRLSRGSPCIDAGTNQAWMATAFDLDGQTRIFDNKLDAVDMGAYESTFPSRSGTVIMIR